MAEIIRGKTNQKGCHVCGKPIVKIGENALVVKDTDGNIAFCSQECADKYNPKIDLGSIKKKSKKRKIDDLMMAAPKPEEKAKNVKTPVKDEKPVKSKPKTTKAKAPAKKSPAKKPAAKKTTKPKTKTAPKKKK